MVCTREMRSLSFRRVGSLVKMIMFFKFMMKSTMMVKKKSKFLMNQI
jgi:hypothetical protein